MPAGRQLHYRVTPVDLHDSSPAGSPVTGTLRTVPRRRDVSFL